MELLDDVMKGLAQTTGNIEDLEVSTDGKT